MLKRFQSFVAKMKARFRGISRATRYEVPAEDLENDAFVLALDIGERRGRPIDFADPDDQELVMRALYVEKAKRGDWRMRRAVRIDEKPDDDDERVAFIERLPATAGSDPLVSLLLRESEADESNRLAASYSQAAAYAITLSNFNYDRQKVCMHLVISSEMLCRRFAAASDSVRVQESIFDRIERIPADFVPLKGKAYVAPIADKREPGQRVWAF